MTPEQRACFAIDRLLAAAGWAVHDLKVAGIRVPKKVGATLTGVEISSSKKINVAIDDHVCPLK